MDFKEQKFFVNLDPYKVAGDLRNFYLERGFSDKKFLDNFGKWYSDILYKQITNLEDCYLKVCFISFTMLEDKYLFLRLFFNISIGLNCIFVFYFLKNSLL